MRLFEIDGHLRDSQRIDDPAPKSPDPADHGIQLPLVASGIETELGISVIGHLRTGISPRLIPLAVGSLPSNADRMFDRPSRRWRRGSRW